MTKRKCCDIVYFKHGYGWDAYRKEDCYQVEEKWIPKWFDMAIVSDSPTKTDVMYEISYMHPLGICLVSE